MKTLFFLLLLSLLSMQSCAQGEMQIHNLDSHELPNTLIYPGNFKSALQWNDKVGANIVLITESGEYPSEVERYDGFRDADLYAFHFIIKENTVRQDWKLYDSVKACPVDIQANFVKKGLQVTDLDANGTAEIWIMYKISCHGDVSPSEIKLVMYEGPKKFVMKGRSRVRVSGSEYEGGEYEFDEAFRKSPGKFQGFAERLWKDNFMEM